jgi:hypothetical protein
MWQLQRTGHQVEKCPNKDKMMEKRQNDKNEDNVIRTMEDIATKTQFMKSLWETIVANEDEKNIEMSQKSWWQEHE